MRIAALAGGIGASKFLLGLYHVMEPSGLTIIANTGDDIVLHGLHISPDPDIVTYTLAGVVNPETGWGFRDESFRAQERLSVFTGAAWFNLGDRDLATHIYRTALLREGKTLSEIAERIRVALGVRSRILPMSDQALPTFLDTDEGRLHLQEYMIRRRTEPVLRGLVFENADKASPAPGVIEALQEADKIVLCPSNPLISIGPILAVPGIREALRARRDDVLAISSIVGGKSLKGPSDRMMIQMGHEPSALGVARLYRDICGAIVIDAQDSRDTAAIEALGMAVHQRQTIMRTLDDKENLARETLEIFSQSAMPA